MSYYNKHVFFCVNQRDDGSSCCADLNARKMRDYAKQKTKDMHLHGPGQIRVNMAGCLGRCELGPTIVVYPDGIWYSYVDEHDIDEIIEKHLLQGVPVQRLMIKE